MRRPRRPPAADTAGRPERRPAGFGALAPLRGKLGSTHTPRRSRAGASSAAAIKPVDSARLSPAADEADLFRTTVGDIQPLTKARGRAELETPKPDPVPRPREQEVTPAAPPPRIPPKNDFELFRTAIGDVVLLPPDDHAELGALPCTPWPLHSRDWKTGDEGPAVRLPPGHEDVAPAALFRHAVRGARPVDTRNRAELDTPRPRPEPLQRREDEQAALRESLAAPMSLEDRLEIGEEAAFLRPGLPRRVLTDLRRGRWVLQGEVDLHGHNRDAARTALAQFLSASLLRGRRCVRVIHGKGLGSPGKVSILKQLSRGWLAQREEILAFCQAGPYEGGSGALLVLLRPGQPAGGTRTDDRGSTTGR